MRTQAWWFGFFALPASGGIVAGKAGLFLTRNVSESRIMGAGHWVVQENTPQVQHDLLEFFTQ